MNEVAIEIRPQTRCDAKGVCPHGNRHRCPQPARVALLHAAPFAFSVAHASGNLGLADVRFSFWCLEHGRGRVS